MNLPRRHYAAILADPPWHYETYSDKGRDRCPDAKHYATMSVERIAALPVKKIAADDGCLFLWITWPMLSDAFFVMTQWGFKYSTCAFCWTKADLRTLTIQMGTGYWTRANSEVCLLGTRGKPKRKNADVRQGIIEPRRQHSRKPDCVHARIERLVDGPYLELFARERRKGWTTWGDQVGTFG